MTIEQITMTLNSISLVLMAISCYYLRKQIIISINSSRKQTIMSINSSLLERRIKAFYSIKTYLGSIISNGHTTYSEIMEFNKLSYDCSIVGINWLKLLREEIYKISHENATNYEIYKHYPYNNSNPDSENIYNEYPNANLAFMKRINEINDSIDKQFEEEINNINDL